MFRAQGLSKRFGGVTALDDVDVEVASGRIVAVIGPNGAGKSSLLAVINGTLRPDAAAQLRLDGTDLRRQPVHRIARAGVATVTQDPRLFASMTVAEDVAIGARFAPATASGVQIDTVEALARVGLDEHADRPTATLTLQEQRRAALARAIVGRPRLLLLDEPMAGLTTQEVAGFVELVRELRDELDLGVLWVEHVMDAVTALADDVVVLDVGRVIARGRPDEVVADPAVVRAYLGVAGSA